MKLSRYIKSLQKALKKHGDLEVAYSADDEGNAYHLVQYTPSEGLYEENAFYHNEPDEIQYYEETCQKKYKVNAIVIN